jgi:hypothetical protein
MGATNSQYDCLAASFLEIQTSEKVTMSTPDQKPAVVAPPLAASDLAMVLAEEDDGVPKRWKQKFWEKGVEMRPRLAMSLLS